MSPEFVAERPKMPRFSSGEVSRKLDQLVRLRPTDHEFQDLWSSCEVDPVFMRFTLDLAKITDDPAHAALGAVVMWTLFQEYGLGHLTEEAVNSYLTENRRRVAMVGEGLLVKPDEYSSENPFLAYQLTNRTPVSFQFGAMQIYEAKRRELLSL